MGHLDDKHCARLQSADSADLVSKPSIEADTKVEAVFSWEGRKRDTRPRHLEKWEKGRDQRWAPNLSLIWAVKQ